MAKLSTIASSPGKDNSFVINCGCMVVAERELCDLLLLEVFKLPRDGLSSHVDVAKPTELSIPPSVDNAVSCDDSRVVVASCDKLWYLTIFMLFKWVWVELMRALDVNTDCV